MWNSACSYRLPAVTASYFGTNRGYPQLGRSLNHFKQVSLKHEKDAGMVETPFLNALKAADIPNKLTMSRMLAIPLFCASFQLDCVSSSD